MSEFDLSFGFGHLKLISFANMEQYISESIQKIDAQEGKENAAR